MMEPRDESFVQATAADLVSDEVALALDSLPEIRDFFTVLRRWDDGVRAGPFVGVAADDDDGGIRDEDGSLLAPVVNCSVSLSAAIGQEVAQSEYHAARAAAAAFLQGGGIRDWLSAAPIGANFAVEWLGEEVSPDGAALVSTFNLRITFSNNPTLNERI